MAHNNTPPEIDKSDTTKNGVLQYKNGTPCKKIPKRYFPKFELSDF